MLQDVVVFGVTVCGDDVYVDLYGSESNVCGSVRFTFPDLAQRRANAAQLVRWQERSTPLAFVAHGTTISLVNERALLTMAGD